MDLAYDQIAQKTYEGDRAQTPTPPKDASGTCSTEVLPTSPKRESLQTEFQETFKAFSASPWGARLGGLWGNVQKQSQSYIETARKEAEAAREEALKGFTDLKEGLVKQTRSLSLSEEQATEKSKNTDTLDAEAVPKGADATLLENDSFIARFRSEAAKRLKDIEKAEDAADEALLRFGTNVRNFLKEAIAVEPAEEERPGTAKPTVLFDSSKPQEIRTSQERRKELLKATSNNPEEVGWDDDSDDEHPSTPHNNTSDSNPPTTPRARQVQTVLESQATGASGTGTLKPEPRRSHDEKSVADSDASYDLVSGATSRAPGSPKEDKRSPKNAGEDSDEDWE